MNMMKIVIATLMLFAFFGCADKNKEVYNKPALYWYGEIIKKIKDFDLFEYIISTIARGYAYLSTGSYGRRGVSFSKFLS